MARPKVDDPTPNVLRQLRFWWRVDRTSDPAGCWPWTGHVSKQGYGLTTINGRFHHASRWAFIIAYGPIPEGLFVCHRCDNPRCCRPTHLFLGTASDNARDAAQKGRCKGWPKHPKRRGETHQAARLSDAQVEAIRQADEQGESRRSIARRFGVSHTYVGVLARGQMRT